VIDLALYELPTSTPTSHEASDAEQGLLDGPTHNPGVSRGSSDEHTQLLRHQPNLQLPGPVGNSSSIDTGRPDGITASNLDEEYNTSSFSGLNALEIAAVAEAKTFLSQRVVQKVVNGIWCGDIVFWDSLSVHTRKKAQIYNDRYVRIRRLNTGIIIWPLKEVIRNRVDLICCIIGCSYSLNLLWLRYYLPIDLV